LPTTRHSVASGICTKSLKYATHFKRNAQAGMVMVNLPTTGVDLHVPFGGTKGSSYSAHEQGRYAQEFYTTVKQLPRHRRPPVHHRTHKVPLPAAEM
jgi:alpha-ketoglutaric semialdehyde dehydrogenase